MFFPENCIECGNCKIGRECFALARRPIGKYYSCEQLVEIILQDRSYYETSGGGVTFSGGEALSFIDYLSRLLPILKEQKIHIAVQTCGYFNLKEFRSKVLPYIDLIYYDFKIMDNNTHKRLLGKSNDLIIENFKYLRKQNVTLIPRIPLIPEYVANRKNLDEIACFLADQSVNHCEFLYYNPGSNGKAVRLNMNQIESVPLELVSINNNREWIDYFLERNKRHFMRELVEY